MSMEQPVIDKKAHEKRKMSDEEAIEEIVADACEMMLRDFISRVHKAFEGVSYAHAEAGALMKKDADGILHYMDDLQEMWDRALVDAVRRSAFNDTVFVRNIVESVGEEKFSTRDLLTSTESKRLESNWNDYKFRGYQFTKRPNGGIIVVMDKTMVYTDKKGILSMLWTFMTMIFGASIKFSSI